MTALLESLGIRDRTGVEAVIESLIAMLDTMDPDPDLEPSLGWGLSGGGTEVSHDREEENEHGGNVEDEPQWDDGIYGI